jgi:hypothetical protein
MKMDLSTRKIHFVQEFLKLESEKAIAQFEKLLEKETDCQSDFEPMSMSEFHNRIEKSSNDAKDGKVTDVDDLLSEIEKWS